MKNLKDRKVEPSKFVICLQPASKIFQCRYDRYGDACLEEDFVGQPKREMRQAK